MENLLETERKDTSMYSKHAEPVKKSYTETKAMGCTDIVYWDGEPQTNPKTGNEFFAPEDAKILFASLKAEKAKEIAEKLREIVLEHNISEDEDEFDAEYYWNLDNYIWEEAANLDDLIDEEKKELRKQDRDFPINK